MKERVAVQEKGSKKLVSIFLDPRGLLAEPHKPADVLGGQDFVFLQPEVEDRFDFPQKCGVVGVSPFVTNHRILLDLAMKQCENLWGAGYRTNCCQGLAQLKRPLLFYYRKKRWYGNVQPRCSVALPLIYITKSLSGKSRTVNLPPHQTSLLHFVVSRIEMPRIKNF